jgi:hypothetical protein
MFIRIPVQCLDGSEVLRGQAFAQQQFQVEMEAVSNFLRDA